MCGEGEGTDRKSLREELQPSGRLKVCSKKLEDGSEDGE